MKKVIFFLPTLGIGGGERVASELSLNFTDPIEIIFVLFKKDVSFPYKGKLISLDIPINNSLFSKIYYFFLAIFRFKKIMKKENPERIISFGIPAGIINILSNKKSIVRVDTFLSSACFGVCRILIKFLFKKSPLVICVSKLSAWDMINNFKVKEERIKVIYNPLNIKEIERLSSEPVDSKYNAIFNKPVIINTGRLTKEKNQEQLIKVFKEIKTKVKEVQLVILGTGELESVLKEKTKKLGISESVHFLGWQKNPFKFLAKAKVFVSVSSREGLPYSVLEAMACGLPVISTDCNAGPREILAPDTNINKKTKNIEYAKYGILIPVIEEQSFQESLRISIIGTLTDERMRNNFIGKAKQRAMDFDTSKIIKEWNFL